MKLLSIFILLFYYSLVSSQTTYQGVSTHFEALGTPYGGCGVPPDLIDSEHFVALNVFVGPNTGSSDFTRPIVGADTVHKGEFNNGKNCGRWIKVTINEDCIGGVNDGALGKGFCRGGNWVNDKYSGAELYMIVTDACGDNNGWCRDSKYHLDLHTSSLNDFEKEGLPVQDMYPLAFHNRKITWEYVKAPNYTGDIDILFLQGAQYYWPAILINHLENGISKVEQKINGNWVQIDRNSDMGQGFILKDLTQPYTIRVYDVENKLINLGKEYTFSIPASCGNACSQPATKPTNIQTYIPPKTQTIQLQKGWNLISTNVAVPNNQIQTVFAGLDVEIVKNSNGFWKKGQIQVLNSLQTILPGEGYLVKMNTSGNLVISGTPLSIVNFPLSIKNGWNIIGCPYQTTTSITTLFDASNTQTIKNFDDFWIPNDTLSTISSLVPGKGYYIKK